MELSLMAVATIMVFMAGLTSAMRVELHAPVDRVFSLSSVLPSSSSPFSYNSNSLVVIYISDESNNSMYQRTCPVSAVALNTTRKTLINLKTRAGCTVSLHVSVYLSDRWSEAHRSRIVSSIHGNRADFEAQNHTIESAINLRLTSLPETELNHCSAVDLTLLVHHVWLDKQTQPNVLSWSATIIMVFLMSVLVHVYYSTLYLIQLRPTIYDYLDSYEVEHQRFEDYASDDE